MTDIPSLPVTGRLVHPADELLVAYLTTGLGSDERHRVDDHVAACDACVQSLMSAHYRLAIGNEIATPVPDTILERVRLLDRAPVAGPAQRAHEQPTWWSGIADRVSALLTLPVLVPAALAAGVLVVVATQQSWLNPPPAREMTRAVETRHSLRVTAAEAAVRAQPSGRAETVATLDRGTVVDISDEERDWFHIVLPDGKSGWVERGAFD